MDNFCLQNCSSRRTPGIISIRPSHLECEQKKMHTKIKMYCSDFHSIQFGYAGRENEPSYRMTKTTSTVITTANTVVNSKAIGR